MNDQIILAQPLGERRRSGQQAAERVAVQWEAFNPKVAGALRGELLEPGKKLPKWARQILPDGVEVLPAKAERKLNGANVQLRRQTAPESESTAGPDPGSKDGPRATVLNVLTAAAGTWLTDDAIVQRAHVRRADALRVMRELVVEDLVRRDGRGRRGSPLRFTLAPRCLPGAPPGTESGTETGTDSNAEL